MSTIDSLLDIFQNVNTTRKQLVESLYVDEACYNEEIDDNLNKEKFEGVYPYSYLLGDENEKSTIIFKDLIKDTDLYGKLYGDEKIIYNMDPTAIDYYDIYADADLDQSVKNIVNNVNNMPNNQKENMNAFMACLKKFGSEIGITNNVGICCILGQVAHESGNFKYFKEIGEGRKYKYGLPDGPFNKIYYGRGPIQVTWYHNYKNIYESFFKKIGYEKYDVVRNPDLALDPVIGSLLSIGWFTLPGNGKRAIEAANRGDVRTCSKAINGGYNGLEDRQKRTLAFADMMGIPKSEIHLNA